MLVLIDHLGTEHSPHDIQDMDSFPVVDDGKVGTGSSGLDQWCDTAQCIRLQQHFSGTEDVSSGAVIQDDVIFAQPSGKEGCFLHGHKAVDLVGRFPFSFPKGEIDRF